MFYFKPFYLLAFLMFLELPNYTVFLIFLLYLRRKYKGSLRLFDLNDFLIL